MLELLCATWDCELFNRVSRESGVGGPSPPPLPADIRLQEPILAMLFAAFVATSLLWIPVRACPRPDRFAFDLVAAPAQVAVRSDMGLDDIEELAARSGKVSQRIPVGFYIGRFFYKVRVQLPARNAGCQEKIRVVIDMDLAGRTIEIGRELRQQPCRFAAALRHYRKHAEADDAVFARYLSVTADALRDASPYNGSLDRPLHPLKSAEITAWVRSVVDHALENMTPDRDAAQAAIDTAEEMQTLNPSCAKSISVFGSTHARSRQIAF